MAEASPPPHNFSRSPVEEVCCNLFLNKEVISLTIQSPYPGWELIRTRITDEIAILKGKTGITGCSLKYNDRFFLEMDDYSRIASGINPDVFHKTKISENEYRLTPHGLNSGHRACIRSQHKAGEQPSWILTFVVETGQFLRFDEQADTLSWFDEAHAVIHTLFDQIVPADIVEMIR